MTAAKKVAAKRARGRPTTGATPDKERMASSKDALIAAGGRRTSVNLSPEANKAVQVLKERHQLRSDNEVINAALIRDLKSKP